MATAGAVVANGSGGADTTAAFKEVYSKLKEEMLEDPAFEFTDESLQWIDRVMLSFLLPLILPSVLAWRRSPVWSRQSFWVFYRVFWAFGDSEDLSPAH